MGQYSSRQDIITSEVSDPRMKNWLCANMAMREASQVLAKGVHREIAELHKNMLRSMGKTEVCRRNCSRSENTWCCVCVRWSKEIISKCEPNYRSRINWSRVNSSQWPLNPYEVARVFMPRAHRLYYKSVEFHEDFRFTLSFLENCYETPISNGLCERAWMFRSRLKRKNNLMRMGHTELEEGISVLKDLVSLPEFDDNEEVVQRLDVFTKSESDESFGGCNVM